MVMPYLAKFDTTGLEGYLDSYPFKPGETVLCLGEIENMPGHVAVARHDGHVYFGYHPENFPRLEEEDLCVKINLDFSETLVGEQDDGVN
jgi:hypothetical protein